MTADFECPHCEREISAGDIPDQVYGAAKTGKFEYECECGARFDVHVDWDPTFYVVGASLVLPATPEIEDGDYHQYIWGDTA